MSSEVQKYRDLGDRAKALMFDESFQNYFYGAADKIEQLEAENQRLRAALLPFTHTDLRLRLGGNSPTEGANAIIFQRNSAKLRLRDFDEAWTALEQDND